MPTVNCCPAQAHTLPLPDFVGGERESKRVSSKATGAQNVSLPTLSMLPLSKFHVRNRHKSYGHILNLCASHTLPLYEAASLDGGEGFPHLLVLRLCFVA